MTRFTVILLSKGEMVIYLLANNFQKKTVIREVQMV